MSAGTTTNTVLLAAAVAGLISGSAMAQVHPEKPTYKYEKCYGVARAGQNDCFFASNSCAGTSAQDDDPRPIPPVRPSPEDCCKGDCNPCIFDLYADALDRFRAELQAWEERRARKRSGLA